jgi:hypothetical protein
MSVEVHVEGQVRYGGLPDFTIALEHYRDYAVANGYTVPEARLGLSGKMNTVRLVYRYDDPSEYAEQESRTLHDREYGKVADELGFTDDSVSYTIYQRVSSQRPGSCLPAQMVESHMRPERCDSTVSGRHDRRI